jgi:hypothetical protein
LLSEDQTEATDLHHYRAPCNLGDGFEELRGLHFECPRQGDDVQECDVTLAALDAAHVVPMETGELRQFLLGKAPFEAQYANSVPKQSASIIGSHPVIIESLTTMSLHTISVIT